MTTEAAAVVDIPQQLSNTGFALRMGCNPAMASRLRSGQRMPSGQMLNRICNTFDLDHGEALRVYGEGPEAFSAWLRRNVFHDPEV